MSPLQTIDLPQLLKGIPAGAWVAISKAHDRAVAFGFDLQKVKAEAESKGEAEPVLVRVPTAHSALLL